MAVPRQRRQWQVRHPSLLPHEVVPHALGVVGEREPGEVISDDEGERQRADFALDSRVRRVRALVAARGQRGADASDARELVSK